METYRIMVIEDDSIIADLVEDSLEKWGYQVRQAENFKNICAQVAQEQPDLILLDINLPFYNGFYWCREIRKLTKIPIIFLSSADDNMNIVMAMDMGGDDFIAKPFDTNVLLAKINAMIRRSYAYQGQVNLISANGVILNIVDGTVAYQGRQTELTKNEFKILNLLMENRGKMVTRDAIMEHLWEDEEFIDDNTLSVNIARIRKKLKDIGISNIIKTKKGVGYLIENSK